MSRLDWSRVNIHERDPAREQRTHDFVEPDRVIVSVSELTSEDRKRLRQQQSRRGKVRAKLKAALKKKPKAKAKPQQKQFTDEEKVRAAEARRIALREHKQRYLAKTRRQLAEAAAKKKSHLGAWLEKQRVLREDRVALNQKWRTELLGRPKEN